MRQSVSLQSLLVAWLLAVGCLGCGGASDRPQLAKVKGTVTYKGKSIVEGDIVFYPENGRSASGQISDGEIVNVETFEKNDGIPLGKMKVTVAAFDGPKDDMYKPPKMTTPEKYNSAKTTDLTADIGPGENTVTFELKD